MHDVCKIPKILRKLLFDRVVEAEKLEKGATKIPKQSFISFWKKHFEAECEGKRVFKLMGKLENNYIEPDDFKPLFKNLLETHPGLEFL